MCSCECIHDWCATVLLLRWEWCWELVFTDAGEVVSSVLTAHVHDEKAQEYF